MGTTDNYDAPSGGVLLDTDIYPQISGTTGRAAYVTGAQLREHLSGFINADAGDPDEIAAAAFAADTPIFISEGTATLTISPKDECEEDTDVSRMAVLTAAWNWHNKCIVTGDGHIDLELGGIGEHRLFGQVALGGDFNIPLNHPPLRFKGPIFQFNTVKTTGGGITFGAREKRVVAVSVTAAGTGYLVAPTISFSGGGGTGATATAYVSGGALTGIVMTAGGSGFTTTPTVVITPVSGGSGATATALINTNVRTAVIPMTSALPANIAVGMPFGVWMKGPTQANDSKLAVGGHVVTAFDTGARTVSVDISPAIFLDDALVDGPPAGMTINQVIFPETWIAVSGGYTGGLTNAEGFMNVCNSGHLHVSNLAIKWVDGPLQAGKQVPNCFGGGSGSPWFEIETYTVVTGFPNRVARFHMSDLYLNRLMAGGGIVGNDGLVIQGGGLGQCGDCMWNSFRSSAISVSDGTTMNLVGNEAMGSSRGYYCSGGVIQMQDNKAGRCSIGAVCQNGGLLNCGTTVLIDRCVSSVDPVASGGPGTILGIALADITYSTTFYEQGVAIGNGGWFAATPAAVTYKGSPQTADSTVAALPAAAAANKGQRRHVTDANATTFLSTVAGGGANIVPVFSTGANWLIG